MAVPMDDASEGCEYDFPDEMELSRTVSEPLADAEVHTPPPPHLNPLPSSTAT